MSRGEKRLDAMRANPAGEAQRSQKAVLSIPARRPIIVEFVDAVRTAKQMANGPE
jgi:hypothetical protein